MELVRRWTIVRGDRPPVLIEPPPEVLHGREWVALGYNTPWVCALAPAGARSNHGHVKARSGPVQVIKDAVYRARAAYSNPAELDLDDQDKDVPAKKVRRTASTTRGGWKGTNASQNPTVEIRVPEQPGGPPCHSMLVLNACRRAAMECTAENIAWLAQFMSDVHPEPKAPDADDKPHSDMKGVWFEAGRSVWVARLDAYGLKPLRVRVDRQVRGGPGKPSVPLDPEIYAAHIRAAKVRIEAMVAEAIARHEAAGTEDSHGVGSAAMSDEVPSGSDGCRDVLSRPDVPMQGGVEDMTGLV